MIDWLLMLGLIMTIDGGPAPFEPPPINPTTYPPQPTVDPA